MTPRASALASPIAKAMDAAYRLSSEGKVEGSFTCPKCGGRIRFTALIAHESKGRCSTAGCVRWPI